MEGINKQAIIAIVAAVIVVLAVVLVFKSMSGGDVNKAEINAQVKQATNGNSAAADTGVPTPPSPGAAGLPGGKRRH